MKKPKSRSKRNSLEISIHWESVTLKDCPLSLGQIRTLFNNFMRFVAKENEWIHASSLLGSSPKMIGLLFCDDSGMRNYQKMYRKLNRSTDILSFPALDSIGAELGANEANLGDLVVSLPAVARGAERGRRTFAEELCEVLIHGALHLLGCDHVVSKRVSRTQAERMRFLQQSLFDRIRPTIKI